MDQNIVDRIKFMRQGVAYNVLRLHEVAQLQMASRFPPVTENSFPSVNKKIIPPFFDFAPYKNHR